MKNNFQIVSALFICLLIFSCDPMSIVDEPTKITEQVWQLKKYRLSDIEGSDFEKDMEELLISTGSVRQYTFKSDGTYDLFEKIAFLENTLSGAWSYNQKTKLLLIDSDSFQVVVLKPGELEIERTTFASNKLFDDEYSNYPECKGNRLIEVYMSQVKDTTDVEGETFTDERDGHVYKVVRIGDQLWMAENLAYLPKVDPISAQNSSLTEPRFYVKDYIGENTTEAKNTDYYKKYGVLYNWEAAKEACPEGWYLPKHYDWYALEAYLGGKTIAGGKMKSTGTKLWKSPNLNATNESGFNGLPGGFRNSDGTFTYYNEGAYWWSITSGSTNAYLNRVWYNSGDTYVSGCSKDYGLSVRCIKKDPISDECIDKNGKKYRTIKLNGKTWMAENYALDLPFGSFAYNNSESNVSTYGRLYYYDYAVRSAPEGWRLPFSTEVIDLAVYLGGYDVAGGELKALTNWTSPNVGATNSTQFSAFPGGYKAYNGAFAGLENVGFWWVGVIDSTYDNSDQAYFFSMEYLSPKFDYNGADKRNAFSVRYVKDEY